MAQRKTPTKTKAPARKSTRTASRKTKAPAKKAKPAEKVAHPGDQEVTLDRRRKERRGAGAPAAAEQPTSLERRKKVNRRRQIDPTTCERDYSQEEIEFMNALDDYKRTSGRMFPTCSEVLEVVRSLGYVKLSPGEQAACGTPPAAAAEVE